jgi:hypothetical protein
VHAGRSVHATSAGSGTAEAVPFQIVPFKDVFFEGRTSEDARAYFAAELRSAWTAGGGCPHVSGGGHEFAGEGCFDFPLGSARGFGKEGQVRATRFYLSL